MKTSTYKYIIAVGMGGLLIACSTKKDTRINRNYHAVTTEYNVLFNGNNALTAGLNDLKTTYADNYWDVLTVERMQPLAAEMEPTDKENPNFKRAEEKATKAIQKHSMYIGGSERNPQMDEAHLLLGQARYYDNRFIPAIEAFNYILLKSPASDKLDEAKVWKEKTNIRLDNDGVAIKNLNKLLKEKGPVMERQVYSDANAMLAQAYIKTERKDSAVYLLHKAIISTKDNEKKARYRFILGQLFTKMDQPDSAYAAYQSVIDMKRKSPRMYVIQAHAMQAGQFNYKTGDTLAFMEKYRDLLEDRENRPYLDVINYQVGLFYDKQKINDKAVEYYNYSLRKKSKDKYLVASSYRNIAEMYFEDAVYVSAGKYYDSTLVYLDSKGREFRSIKKKRENLGDVIKYEAIAQNHDSILNVVAMSPEGRVTYYEDYIAKLKIQDELTRKKLEEEARRQANMAANANSGAGARPGMFGDDNNSNQSLSKFGGTVDAKSLTRNSSVLNSNGAAGGGTGAGMQTSASVAFPFYNPSTVSFGKLEFQKRWGNRPDADNWRVAAEMRGKGINTYEDGDAANAGDSLSDKSKEERVEPRYTPNFYISQLPTDQKVIDSLAKERNFAYYQLGNIYNDKFKEYKRAAVKFEGLLKNSPEERLILPSKYNLYKIYMIIDPSKAEAYKQQVLTEYPDSRYAEMIRNPASDNLVNGTPEAIYAALYKKYQSGDVREAAIQTETYIDTFTGEEIVSKFELLKARITGRLQGLEEYKKALNYVALTYPNSSEGKQADEILKKEVPALDKLAFGQTPVSYKLIFKFAPNDPKIKPLTDKIQQFIKDGNNNNITMSNDIYTTNENFIVIHGLINKLAAVDAISILKDYKTYKITETPVIISNEDYKVVQVKKNFADYQPIQ